MININNREEIRDGELLKLGRRSFKKLIACERIFIPINSSECLCKVVGVVGEEDWNIGVHVFSYWGV